MGILFPTEHSGMSCGPQVPLMILILLMNAAAAFSADQSSLSSQERSALGAVFDEVQVIESPLSVLQKAALLEPEPRFEFLSRWVLPNDNHDTLRLVVGFTPTGYPSSLQPDFENSSVTTVRNRVPMGGSIVAPAAELMRVADQLGRLDEVLLRISEAPSDDTDQQITKLAGLVLVNCSAGHLDTAKNRMADLYQAVASHQQIRSSWKGPLLLAVQAGSQADATAAAARDLAFDIVQTEIGNIKSSEWRSFHRHIMLLAEKCVVQLSNSPLLQRGIAAARIAPDSDPPEKVRGLRDIREPDAGLTQWQSSTLLTAFSSAAGGPNDVWHWDGQKLFKASGHRKEYLYFQSPLRGNYEIEFDASASTWRNTHVMIGGHWTGTGSQDRFMLGTLGNPGYAYEELSQRMAKFRTAMHYRAVVRGTSVSFYGNGRLLRTVELSEGHDPWVAFGRLVKNTINISNVRITGDPVIPEQICLSASNDLTGWITYYNESIGGRPEEGRRWCQDGDAASGGIISCGTNGWLEPGMFAESLAYYHRPMLEDGTIEYEFLYKENGWHTHPALGNTVFLLEPDGVRIHQLTNRILERSELSPGNAVAYPDNRRGPKVLPLRPDEWNLMTFKLNGDSVDLYLNDEHIYQHTIAAHNRRNFGLFHFSELSQVYARNIVWNGEWPKTLPSLSDQELVGHDTDFLDITRRQLAQKFTHTFDDTFLPRNDFGTPSTDPNHVIPGPDGITLTREGPAEGYKSSIIEAALGAGGDFDIIVSFDSFKTELDPNDGSGNVYLQVVLDDDYATELHIRRRQARYKDRLDQHHLAYADYVQRQPEETRRDCVGYMSTESLSGSLRLARRGSKVYFLFAEGSSSDFRIVSSMECPISDIRVGGVNLRVLTHRNSLTSARFKTLDVRADRLFGPATIAPPSQDLIAEIDKKRAALPVQAKYDFTKEGVFNDEFSRTSGVLPWRAEAGGQEFVHVGTDRWRSSSAIMRSGFEGDFDITTTFELQKIVNPQVGRESGVYLKTKIGDTNRHQPEVMFRQRGTSEREVEARIGRQPPGQSSTWKRVRGISCDNAASMRIARYGTTVYYLTRLAPEEPEILIATLDVPNDPVREHGTWLMVHAMGEGRETYAMFKSLEVRAARLTERPEPQIDVRQLTQPAPPSPPKSRTKSLLESLFDAF